MVLTDKGPQGKPSATLGLAGGKLCFVRDTSAVSEATGSAGGASSTRRGIGVSKGRAGKAKGKAGKAKGKAGKAKGKFQGRGILSHFKFVSDDVGDIELGVLGQKVEVAPGNGLATKGATVAEIEVIEVEDDDDVTAIEVRSGASGTAENVSVVRATGGLAKGMTDDKLLSTVDMFLTTEQRLRKRAIQEDRLKARKDMDENSKNGAPGDSQDCGSSAKRPRVIAPIFGKPIRGATSGGRGSVDRVKWIEMPAPFSIYRHVIATSPMEEVDDKKEGCNVGANRKGLQLLSDVVPGGLPPLPLIVSPLDSRFDRGGEARNGSRPKIAFRRNDASATGRGSLLPSPAAILFAGLRPRLNITKPEDDVGDMTVIPKAKKEQMIKIAAAKRKEDAAADTMWTELYRPRSPDEVCGNAHVVNALSRWLGEWKERRGRPGDARKRSLGMGGNSDDSEMC